MKQKKFDDRSGFFLAFESITQKGGSTMRSLVRRLAMFFVAVLTCISLISLPATAIEAAYPDKPITLYIGYAAGATTDISARALAAQAEKLLGVPIVVENRAGGSSTVAAGLLTKKKPDGYTLAVISSGALITTPHILKLPYDSLKDFTYVYQYSRWVGGLCVKSDSPIKTIDDFISYAKAHPGLSYSASGKNTQQHLAVESFARCKGLTFRHVPVAGGAEGVTLFLGGHTDFIGGSGSHLPYVQRGLWRMLVVYNTDARDPKNPDVPMLKEIGCRDVPASTIIIAGPKGMPADISNKLAETFKKVTEGPEFQKMLDDISLPYDVKDRATLEKDIPVLYEWWRNYYKEIGTKTIH
jgi:tripartite-type tricarboxylate transporter receptor subunit TctC